MDYGEAIAVRHSSRTFIDRPLTVSEENSLTSWIEKNWDFPFASKVRVQLLSAQGPSDLDFKQFGTYGFIKNCPAFAILAVENGPFALENLGYAGEKLVLGLTQMGLASCWLGGSFKQGKFAQAINCGANELVPAVIAFGHIAPKPSLLDRAIRWSAKAKTRQPLDKLVHGSIPSWATDGMLAMQAAPSASNKQPWRFIIEIQTIHFFIAEDSRYQRILKIANLANLQKVDMGIALSHLVLWASSRGWNAQVVQNCPVTSPNSTWIYSFSVAITF